MKLFSRIALALLLTIASTIASAFAEEVVPAMDSAEKGIVPDVDQTEPAEGVQVVDAADDEAVSNPGVEDSSPGIELASASLQSTSSSETASVSPAPWGDTMSALRTGSGSPEGARNPNELHISWENDKEAILIGAGAVLLLILLIAALD